MSEPLIEWFSLLNHIYSFDKEKPKKTCLQMSISVNDDRLHFLQSPPSLWFARSDKSSKAFTDTLWSRKILKASLAMHTPTYPYVLSMLIKDKLKFRKRKGFSLTKRSRNFLIGRFNSPSLKLDFQEDFLNFEEFQNEWHALHSIDYCPHRFA